MSVKIMSAVWENGPASASDTLMLLALADHADDNGVCYPGVERLAHKCRITRRGAQKILRRLEAEGWITTDIGGGRFNCNAYRINPINSEPRSPANNVRSEPRDTKQRTTEHKPRTRVHETANGGSPEPSRTIIEPSREPPRASKLALVDDVLSTEFEKIWTHYPRRVGKATAFKAWRKARSRADYEVIAAPLRLCIRSWQNTPPDKIPHFATWLNRDGWLDDPEHAANRPQTSTEDLRRLGTITSSDDLAALFSTPQLRIAK